MSGLDHRLEPEVEARRFEVINGALGRRRWTADERTRIVLPRIETVVDIESDVCPCCSGRLHRIGEDVAERLDIVPAQFRVLVVRRPKYACRSCEDLVVQAPAPARLIEGGIPTEATVAQVLVSNTQIICRCTVRPRSMPVRV